MSTLITIYLKNNSNSNQTFFFFQQPAVYIGGGTVYSNSLFSQTVAPYASSGSLLTFQSNMQFYAGVQQSNNQVPIVGTSSGFLSASQPIDLATTAGTEMDSTKMSVNPLGLSPKANTPGVQSGAFRITTPTYDTSVGNYLAGSAVNTSTGGIVLSNFVVAGPNQNIDAQPILKFYVQTGTYTSGTVMNFTQSSTNAALCDATQGIINFQVSYSSSGTWTVINS